MEIDNSKGRFYWMIAFAVMFIIGSIIIKKFVVPEFNTMLKRTQQKFIEEMFK